MDRKLTPDIQNLLSNVRSAYFDLRSVSWPGSLQLVEDYLNVENTQDSDSFFEKYGVGNFFFKVSGGKESSKYRPFDREVSYRRLLHVLKLIDEEQYSRIHKGTPYYFLGWLNFELGNYSKGFFYLDLALSEDKKNKPDSWRDTPGTKALLLDADNCGPAMFTVLHLFSEYKESLKIYNQITGKIASKRYFARFRWAILDSSNSTDRTILTSFYGFLLESETVKNMLDNRGSESGSIEPFLLHLFKGALVYESILKFIYKKNITLNKLVNSREFKKDIGLKKQIHKVISYREKFSNILEKSQGTDLDTSLGVLLTLRDITAHQLSSEDIFNNVNDYILLYRHIIRVIYETICSKNINKRV